MHVLEEISTDQYFNSQPHKEADTYVRQVLYEALAFQLTASQGG